MKREAGWGAAAVVAIAAAVGISSFQTKPTSGSANTKNVGGNSAPSASPAARSFDAGPCAELETLLQAFFVIPSDQIEAPSSCYPDGRQNKTAGTLQEESKNLRFVIATLPDPLHTHFPLIFDREAEAIQQAAQDEEYLYDSSWLPWETEEVSYVRIQDRDQAEERKGHQEDQPGLLLFRARLDSNSPTPVQPFRQGLAVFIVGEEPTGGIHRLQFENAVAWIKVLQPRSGAKITSVPTVQIIGPSFSGSLPSLAELLEPVS